jgi:hypothetical protein
MDTMVSIKLLLVATGKTWLVTIYSKPNLLICFVVKKITA